MARTPGVEDAGFGMQGASTIRPVKTLAFRSVFEIFAVRAQLVNYTSRIWD